MDKKEQIIDVAKSLFSEKGFDKTPVAEICEKAKVSHGLLFHHFKNKNGLLRAIFEKTTNQVVEMNKSLDRTLRPIERLNILIDQAFDSMVHDKLSFRLYLNIMFQPSTRLVLADLIQERFSVLLEQTKYFFEELPAEKQTLYSYQFISELDGIGMNYIYSFEGYPLREIKAEFKKRYNAYIEENTL
ncbi:TetR/AcrR family transcriptional regulator [Flammeovirga agarivorans]|uniref:TetR/AcrR family transcriptional regulator n=1 Tax=Flammeovirga agarivorans TaxID=2726742 RepID=A0A7X8XYS3_9BACT|nr:TetR/AcrR family transcriptional regulator [Flammeovirga agarivorans]NLR94471.1 TetR/AcrR family transcriptional regulator [Flammeovirga agarivorans]